MKKILIFLTIFAMLFGLSACTTRYKSQQDILPQLNGLWLAEADDESTYYYFSDGKYFVLDAVYFGEVVQSYLDYLNTNAGIEALRNITFQAFSKTITEERWIPRRDDLTTDPEKGVVKLHDDTKIVIDDTSVKIKHPEKKKAAPMQKVSDTLDLSGTFFEDIFNSVRNSYTISTSQMWTNAADYSEMVKGKYSDINNWDIYTQNEETTIYKSNPWVPTLDGQFQISADQVTLTYKIHLYESWEQESQFNPSYYLHYSAGDSVTIIHENDLSLDVISLLECATYAFRNFPNAQDAQAVYNTLQQEYQNNNYTIENGAIKLEVTINGIQYTYKEGTSGHYAYIFATAEPTMTLSQILVPTQQEATPEQTEPAQTSPGSTSTGSLLDVLDFSKAWKTTVDCKDYKVAIDYAFSEDGTCWVMIGVDDTYIDGTGEGTYTIDGNKIDFDIVVSGQRYTYGYEYDPATGELIHQYGKPILNDPAAMGGRYPLEVDDVNDVEKIKHMVELYKDPDFLAELDELGL